MNKMDQYVDKEQAVGVIYCLEQHFRRITEMLNYYYIPQKQSWLARRNYTVEERVTVLLEAFNCFPEDQKRKLLELAAAATDINDEGPSPLEIQKAINDEIEN